MSIRDIDALTAALTAGGLGTLTAGGALGVSGSAGAGLTTTTSGGVGSTTTFGATGTAVTGALLVTSTGAVSQNGQLTVSTTSNIGAGGNDITLANGSNDFTGAVTVTGGAISLRDTNAMAMGVVTNGPNQSVSLVAGTTLTLPAQALGTGTAALTLRSDGGTLATAGTLSGGVVALTGAGGLSLGHNVAGSTLVLASTNTAINQTAGAINATGATTVTAGTGNISLAQANDFGNTVTATGAAITLNDTNALTAVLTASGLSTLTATGSLAASGTAASLSASGAGLTSTVATTGASTLTGNAGTSVSNNANVGGTLTTSGGATTLAGTLGALNTTTATTVTQTAALSVAGATNVNASGAITLDNVSNDLNNVKLETPSNVVLNTGLATAVLLDLPHTAVAGGSLQVVMPKATSLVLVPNSTANLAGKTVASSLDFSYSNLLTTASLQTGGVNTQFVVSKGTALTVSATTPVLPILTVLGTFNIGTLTINQDGGLIATAVASATLAADEQDAQKQAAGIGSVVKRIKGYEVGYVELAAPVPYDEMTANRAECSKEQAAGKINPDQCE